MSGLFLLTVFSCHELLSRDATFDTYCVIILMSKKLLFNTIALLSLLPFRGFSQAPGKLQFQAVIRNANGQPYPIGSLINVRFTISDTPDGSVFMYREFHLNTYVENGGLIHLQIGTGKPAIGKFPAGKEWGGDKYLRVETDTENSGIYTSISTVQLISVPYSMYAEYARITQKSDSSGFSERSFSSSFSNKALNADFASVSGNADSVKFLRAGYGIYPKQIYQAGATAGQVLSWDGKEWKPVDMNIQSGWNLSGNSNIDTITDYIGTSDNSPLHIRTNDTTRLRILANGNIGIGIPYPTRKVEISDEIIADGLTIGRGGGNNAGSTAIGNGALMNSGKLALNNTAIGYSSLRQNVSGSNNTSVGCYGMSNNYAGSDNTATGSNALYRNEKGNSNSAFGVNSLNSNLTGNENVGMGSNTLRYNLSGSRNTAIGADAHRNSGEGSGNTAIGYKAMSMSYKSNSNVAIGTHSMYSSNGRNNTVAVGDSTLMYNGSSATVPEQGTGNTALGSKCLRDNNTGYFNTAVGSAALFQNYSGFKNTNAGYQSGYFNSNGSENSSLGYQTLYFNTTGSFNTALGSSALAGNVSASYNCGVGYRSLYSNATGSNNTAIGQSTMFSNKSAGAGTAVGSNSLYFNEYGNYNTAIGNRALYYTLGWGNTAIGYNAFAGNTSGRNNTAMGNNTALGSGNLFHAVAIGAYAEVNASGTMSFGRQDSVNRWAFGRSSVASGAFQVGHDANDGNSAYLSTGGAWTNASDISLKSDISEISGSDILSKVKQLNITRWKYTGTDEYHIGPMAQQFYQLFGTGTDDHSISTIDPAGVALKAIQEQQKIIEELTAKYNTVISELNAIKASGNK